jgi:hypothetical protein
LIPAADADARVFRFPHRRSGSVPAPFRYDAARRVLAGFAAIPAAVILAMAALAACAPTEGDTGEFDVVETTNADFEVDAYVVGVHPVFVAAGDIDQDGTMDLAVSNRFGDSITLLTGDLEESATLDVDREPSDIVIADLDGATGLDLALLHNQGRRLTVFLNDGAGGWETATEVDLLGPATQLVAADLNGDGSPVQDLLLSASGDDQMQALVNDGAGQFTQVVTATGTAPARFVTGLWNEDANLDVAVLSTADDTLTILLGDGLGGFAEAEDGVIETRTNPEYLASADFDDDGLSDLAVTSRSENLLSAYRGFSDGHFDLLKEKQLQSGATQVVSGAFDTESDGPQDDLAIVNRGRRIVTVLLWDSSESRFLEEREPVPDDPISIVTADFDQDGCADLAVPEQDLRQLAILTGQCNGEFDFTRFGFSSEVSHPLVVDMDADGALDLVLVQTQNQRVIVLRNVH